MTTAPTLTEQGTLRAAYDIGRLAAPTIIRPDGGIVALVPHGTQQVAFDPIDKPLPRIDQDVTMHDRDSFASYVNRYKSDKTRLFAEPGFLAGGSGAHITASLDYHLPDKPERCAHDAFYRPRYSDQWKRWNAACAQPMKQAEFAEFIEETRADIRDPDAAKLLDIVRTFKANKKVEFDSVAYQPNGDVKLYYDEKTLQQGASGILPEAMKLGIPVYFRGTVFAVPVFVRYKVGSGAVMFQLKMDRPDVIEDEAFGELVEAIAKATEIEVYLGRRA